MSGITGEIGYKVGAAGNPQPKVGLQVAAPNTSVPVITVTAGTNTSTTLQIWGDGHGQLGGVSGTGFAWNPASNVTLTPAATSSARALTVVGVGSDAMLVAGTSGWYAGKFVSTYASNPGHGLWVQAGTSNNDTVFILMNSAQVQYGRVLGDGHGFWGITPNGIAWGTSGAVVLQCKAGTGTPLIVQNDSNAQSFAVSPTVGAVIVGTTTLYSWVSGTNYPIIQLAGIGGIMGTATMGVVTMGGGLYWNGTHYTYGQAGTGVVASLGTGTFVLAISTAGTAGQSADPTTIVAVDSKGMVFGTLTNTTQGAINVPVLFVNGTQLTGGAAGSVTNPSALVSTTATNGVSTSAMRADGAPAIDQAMNPTWTGTHIFNGANTPVVIGTSTVYGWGGGTQYGGAMQIGMAGGITNEVTTPSIRIVAGAYWNGTNFIYTGTNTNNSGTSTGFVLLIEAGALLAQYLGPGGTFGGTCTTITNVFAVNGTVSPTVRGYGPTAAGLVDMTPDTGSWVGTFGGYTATVVGTAWWSRNGNNVTVAIPYGTGSSNATSFTFNNVPAAIRPTRTQWAVAAGQNSGAAVPVTVEIVAANGTWTFGSGVGASAWTASGAKTFGVSAATWMPVSYTLS